VLLLLLLGAGGTTVKAGIGKRAVMYVMYSGEMLGNVFAAGACCVPLG